jgi:choline dehydrogenase
VSSNPGEADYIIVGAGAAGCVLASRLSEDGRRSVAVLEAGSSDRHPWVTVPAAVMRALSTPRFDWGYKTEPDPTRGGKVEHWLRGRLVGGSASINGMVFVRGQPLDFDDWEAAGADGWSYQGVLPYFARLETTAIGEDSVRGRSGPLKVTEAWAMPSLVDTFVDACGAVQIPFNADYNGRSQAGVGRAQANVYRGARQSSARAFLSPALKRRNLALVRGAHVSRLLWDAGRAVGVEYYQGSDVRTLRCRREVILAAGAINSPQLLMLSGVGPATALRSFDISVVSDLTSVGQNLVDHPAFGLGRNVSIPTLNEEATPLRVAVNALRWLATRDGPATAIAAQALAFIRTRAELDQPDAQLHFSSTAYAFEGGEVSIAKTSGVLISANVSRPKSRGYVALRSGNFRDRPIIQPLMFDVESDLATLVRAVRVIEQIYEAPAFERIVVKSQGDMVWQSDAELREHVRANANVIYHPAGTCRMGEGGALDARLRVRGVGGLRVADASVFPSMVSGNTNAAAMMVGEKASDLIRDDERNAPVH